MDLNNDNSEKSERENITQFKKIFVFKKKEYPEEEVVKRIKKDNVFIEENYNYVPGPMASIIILALSDCCAQIHILAGFEKEDQMKSTISLKRVQQITEDYHINDPIYDRITAQPFLKAFHQIKLRKLTEDSLFIKKVLSLLKQEIRNNSSYTTLTELINELHIIKDEESDLMDDQMANFQKMVDLKTDLRNVDRESVMRLLALNEEIWKMRDITEDIYFENVIRTRYVRYWENARTQQNNETHSQAINELVNTIIKYKSEMATEERIHNEIENFLDKNRKEIADKINRWAIRYDRDVERRNVEMAILREKREEQENSFLELQGVYLLKKQQIEDYLMYKERVRLEAERFELHTRKAIKIQAWWRGLMVRRKLGPFNPRRIRRQRRKEEAAKAKAAKIANKKKRR